MRPILHLILTFSVTGLSVSAWGAVPQDKWEGYKPVEQAELPPQVRQFAENSVFYMQTVDALNGEEIEVIDIENDPRAKTKVTDKKTLTENLFPFQVETCRKQRLRYCPVAKAVTKGTMFFNNNRFYTCRHSFHNWLTIAAEANNKSVTEISPPIILSMPDKKDPGNFKVVYQSAFESKTQMNFSFINDDPILNIKINEKDSSASGNNALIRKVDFVEINLASSKSKSIIDNNLPVLNLNSLSKNIENYSIGYPNKTQSPSLGNGNSPGDQLSITHGSILGFYDDRNLFYSSNFGSPGMSGSPVVTQDGKLIGMTCSSFNNKNLATQPSQVNAGFFPLDTNRMSAFWNSTNLAQQSSGTEQKQEDSTSTILN